MCMCGCNTENIDENEDTNSERDPALGDQARGATEMSASEQRKRRHHQSTLQTPLACAAFLAGGTWSGVQWVGPRGDCAGRRGDETDSVLESRQRLVMERASAQARCVKSDNLAINVPRREREMRHMVLMVDQSGPMDQSGGPVGPRAG